MNNPVSYAVVPPQPSKEFFSLRELALFEFFTRESYLRRFGAEAVAFDPSKAVKGWFDSGADTSHPDNVAVYRVVGRKADGSFGFRQLVIPAADAASVNLPGSAFYAPYVVSTTNAKRTGPGTLTPQPLNPEYLSSYADAQQLMVELGGTAVVEEPELGGGFGTYFPPDEDRRLWEVVLGGHRYNAGTLLRDRHAKGKGAPGRWESRNEGPVWIPQPPSVASENGSVVDFPVRDLLPNEEFRVTLMGPGVARKDLSVQNGADGFREADRAMLTGIYRAMFPGS